METPHPAAMPDELLLADCDVRRLRRGGPGGQRRNKVETAVIVKHRPTGIAAEANERRSQAENRQQALRRLRIALAIDVRLDLPGESRYWPSDIWRRRTVGGKISVSPRHDDFPTLLAEALDATAAAGYVLSAAATELGVSGSQLARFFQKEHGAWQQVNDARRKRGLDPLR